MRLLPGQTIRLVKSIVSILGLLVTCLVLMSCAGTIQPTLAPTVALPLPSPSSSSTPTRIATPTIVTLPTPIPTLEPLPVPTLQPGAQMLTFYADPNRTGSLGSKDNQPRWNDRNLSTGKLGDQTFLSLVQFNLQELAPNSKILFATLELTGRDSKNLGVTGSWLVDLIDSETTKGNITFDPIAKSTPLGTIAKFESQNIAAGLTKRIILSSALLKMIEGQLENGKITIRLGAPSTAEENLFVWDGGAGRTQPVLYVVAIPGSFSIITAVPTLQNVFAAATSVAQRTAQARAIGTPTPMSRAFVTATPGPGNVVVTTIPTPESTTARTATSVYATAVAATTGTFTPMPFNWVTATPDATATFDTNILLVPRDAITRAPTPTNTPTPIHPIEWAKRTLPSVFYNKIMFLEGDHFAPKVWIMDPDGTNLQLVRDPQYFSIAKGRDGLSPDGNLFVYNAQDDHLRWQIWVRDARDPLSVGKQLTFFSRPLALVFGPSWSPDSTKIAFTSDDTGRQEIYLYDTQLRIYRQLTFSTGPWWWNQSPSWSPDGKQIVYSSDHGHDGMFSEIWIMNADGSGARNLGDGILDAYNPVWIKWRQ